MDKKNTNNNSNNNIVLTVLGIATLLVAITGASFAYFTATSITTNQNIKTGVLKISTTTGSVQGANIKPVKESDINTITKKKENADVIKIPITVNTTDTTIDATLDVYMTAAGFGDKTYTNGNPTDIKWELLDSTDTNIGSGSFDMNTTDLKLNTNSIETVSDKTTYNYTLLIYILDNNDIQDDLQDLTLSATLRVDAKQA